jgi:hypothetical protein
MPSVEGVDDDVLPRGFGVRGKSSRQRGTGVKGESDNGHGVFGESENRFGVFGHSSTGSGVHGQSDRHIGVSGSSTGIGVLGWSVAGNAVVGETPGSGVGVSGTSSGGDGVLGTTYRQDGVSFGVIGNARNAPDGSGVYGLSLNRAGVLGYSIYGSGVYAEGFRGSANGVVGISWTSGVGVLGRSIDGVGVSGYSNTRYGVKGESDNYPGVYGLSNTSPGVVGRSNTSWGMFGFSNDAEGVHGYSNTSYGLYASSDVGLAALLEGRVDMTSDVNMTGPVTIIGPLQKPGGSFKIDHPLDPTNKYLSHSFVESPDMKNIYDGVVVLDEMGEAMIELPDWFGALNKDFRYQLTAIGAPGPNLYIAEEISNGVIIGYGSNTSSSNGCNNNRFKVAGGTPGMKVSWHVTGIRKDPWANANRIAVEEDKPAKERGYYTYPELYGQPEEKGISRLLFARDEEEKEELPLPINNQNKLTT